jgi:GTP pyrophosphokinase
MSAGTEALLARAEHHLRELVKDSAAASAAALDRGARAPSRAEKPAGAAESVTGPTSIDDAIGQGRATAQILAELGADEAAQAAALLVQPELLLPVGKLRDQVDPAVAHIVDRMRQLLRLSGDGAMIERPGAEREPLRRMLLAMADDIRVVLVFLAWRLQRLRDHAARRETPSRAFCEESLRIVAPLANRLGLWQLKWEIEDLAFRFLEPDTYRGLARQLEAKRAAREAFVERAAADLKALLASNGLRATVTGRPKHLFSIHNKMKRKGRSLEGILDLRGLRVIVETVPQCYAALDQVHQLWSVIESEFDDYIARPKPNGYRSLHTVVRASDGQPLEVQIRTREMHEAAEYGVASHWRYKEGAAGAARAGAAGGPVLATSPAEASARAVEWVRALLAWQREVGQALGSGESKLPPEGASRVYALTPQGRVIELPAGSTPIDFAYHVHSGLGHRCRGARVNGQMVPLNRPLETGQTVEIISAKEGAGEGPSRDWLNAALGYVASPRARTKVRQWFHALDLERDQATGRERIERVLQREGRTALSFDELARRLAQPDAPAMFVAVAREEIGPRQIEEAVRSPTAGGLGASASAAGSTTSAASTAAAGDIDPLAIAAARGARRSPVGSANAPGSRVLIVGIDSLLSQLARCCRPVPPDPISGFVTRGRGVSVHRRDCATLARMVDEAPERLIETEWDPGRLTGDAAGSAFPADIEVLAHDRQGLLRDISEVFARDRINVTGARTQSRHQQAMMRFTIEVKNAAQLGAALAALRQVKGVGSARRL